MEKRLKLAMGQIHNPTNEWMSCTLGSNGAKIIVSPVPPRSTRPLPTNILNPQIVQESILPPNVIAKFTSDSATVSSSIVVEALELVLEGTWTGDAKVLGTHYSDVEAVICIKEKEINGWFKVESVTYFFTGNLNTLSRDVVFIGYSTNGGRPHNDIRGNLQVDEGMYILTALPNDFLSFTLSAGADSLVECKEDPQLEGRYLGYYEKGPSSFEMNATLMATKKGIVTGRGNERETEFAIIGMIDANNNTFFFIRLKGPEVTYYEGDANLTREIFFQGRWHSGSGQKGGFTLMKVMH